MTFTSPHLLWLLVGVAGLLVAQVALGRRHRHRAVRHPDLDLVRAVAPRSAAWRRHLVVAAMSASVAAMVLGLARPAHSVEAPREDAVVVLAIDISGSMTATDVAPSRLEAAVTAARDFVASAPEAYRIGLVAFDDAGHLLVAPTTDRASLDAALRGLERGPGTAAGDGLLVALDAVEAAVGEDEVIVDAGDDEYAAVVLLADGASTVGTPLADAADAAAEAEVPVYTIAYGTDAGMAEVGGEVVPVPADPAAMAEVAEVTGGDTYEARSGAELDAVYDEIGTRIGTIEQRQELTVAFAAVAAVLLAAALLGAGVWSPRLV